METESLTCTVCSTVWQRPKARGRKPKLCSSCFSDSVEITYNTEEDDDQDPPLDPETPPPPTTYRPGSKWQCTACTAKIKIGVGINEPPIHKCPKRANRVLQLSLL